MILWHFISGLGKSVITLPIALIIAIWILANHEWRMAVRWCIAFGVAMFIVLVSKIAFLGWGIGIQSLDFTGISGHSARSAAIYPVLFFCVLQGSSRKIISYALSAGVALGLLISVSRVMVHAHSWSEIVAGWLLGTFVTIIFFQFIYAESVLISRRWLLMCSLIFVLISPSMKSDPTHGWVVKVALFMSNHEVPYSRAMWKPS